MEWFTAAQRLTTALASSDPTPGGGAAAAHTAAMGCALAMMAIGTTLKRKNTSTQTKQRLDQSLKRLGSLKTQLNMYTQQDGEAYTAYLTAAKLPKEDTSRAQAVEQALLFAARVPADTAVTAIQVLKEIETVKEDIAPVIVSDILCARHLLQAGIRCAVENIRANVTFLKNEDSKKDFETQIKNFLTWC